MSLHAFVAAHRAELIEACRLKSTQRREHGWVPAHAEGVAAFLDHLVEVLLSEPCAALVDTAGAALAVVVRTEASEAAARHGAFLLSHGYSTEQVVHEYGDVCQAITGMAIALSTPFTTDEFRVLNRCLDDAIAEAVAAHGALNLQHSVHREGQLASRLDAFADDCQRVTLIAIHAHSAILTGKVGMNGATGALLGHSLNELLYLAEQARAPTLDVQVRVVQ